MRSLRPPTPHDMPIGRRRPALVLLVMLLCGAGFWANFKNRFAAIEARHGVTDPQGLLLPQEREKVLTLRAMLREQWGLGVRVLVNTGPDASSLDGKTVLISLQAQNTLPQATVVLPPLVDKALTSGQNTGSPYSARLETDLNMCATTQAPGKCVEETLVRLLVALGDDPTPIFSTPPALPSRPAPRSGDFRAPLSATPPADTRAPALLQERSSQGDSHAQSS